MALKQQQRNGVLCAVRADGCARSGGTVFSVLSVLRCYKQDYLVDRANVSGLESSWESTVVGQSPAGKNVSTEAEDIVRSRYQKIGEHKADWEDLSVCCNELQSVN
jgi:hypothetical protein